MTDYSLITHSLPTSIRVEDTEYRIDTRVCKALQVYLVADDEGIPASVKVCDTVERIIIGKIAPELYTEAYGQITEFLKGYPSESAGSNHKPIISCEQDHALIVAGFRQAYGISLAELKAMHWWEFLALLSGLPESTRIAEVMKVRAMPINGKDSPEVRQAKIKAKNAVAIKNKRKTNESGFDIISQALESEGN